MPCSRPVGTRATLVSLDDGGDDVRPGSEETKQQQVTLTRQAIVTPRAAAVTGIIFSVWFASSMVLSLPEALAQRNLLTDIVYGVILVTLLG